MIEPAGPVAVWNHGTVDDDCRKWSVRFIKKCIINCV
jgi:hypothetical protein